MASASLRRPHRWLGAISFALLVVACLAVVPSPAQADQIINPKHDNIFLNVSPEEGHRVLISIIYNSFWLGALGWDVFSTIHFDWRVAKETNYRSVFSVCNTLAYWISRYFTFLWVLRVLIDAITLSDYCAGRFRTSASFYGVCVCGTYFVFLLRTANLWRMDLRALVPLMFSMAIMIGFCAPLPYISDPFIAEGSPFCNYRVGGRFSYGVLASCALFDIINFALLYLKLVKSGQGFKGVLKCLQPMTKAAYDHEEVSRMLLQKTFVFVAAQFGLLISLAILYATTTEQNYQLMQVTAFHAISASMGGRIFRRAWKLTREQSPTNIALPPDYSPDWARSRGSAGGGGGGAGDLVTGGGDGTEGLGGIDGTPVLVKKESKSLRDDASYIEGELNYPVKDTKSILPRTQGRNGSIAASHTSQRSVEDDASQRSHPHAQGAVAIEMGDVAQSSTPVSASSTLAVPPSPFTPQPLKKLGGIGRASRDKRRAATSHGPGVASTDFASGSRQRPSTSYTPISAPVQIISPGADANTSAAFISSKGDGTTPYNTAHEGTTASAASTSSLTITPASIMALAGARQQQQTQHLGSRSPSKSTLRDARRPRSSSSVVSSSSASTYQPPMLPLDQQPRRSSATPLRTTFVPSPPSSSLTSGNTTRRPSAIDDEQQQAPNPLDAFYTAVHADEARHASGGNVASVSSSPFDTGSGHDADGRPRTSRGGPVAPFGARERTRSHSTDKGVSVLAPPSSAGAAERPTSPARPGTSHGPATAAPAGSFVRLRSPPASSSGRRPGTSSGAADPPPPFGATSSGGGAQQHQQRPISPKTVQPPAYIPATATPEPPSSSSAIDEAYRELEQMASLSRSNSIATTSASAHTSSCSG